MNMVRKIACKYLRKQYERAKKYLEVEVKEGRDIANACENVRRAGAAYAQTEFVIFIKDGIRGESVKCKLNADNSVTESFLYTEFIDEVETYIQSTLTVCDPED